MLSHVFWNFKFFSNLRYTCYRATSSLGRPFRAARSLLVCLETRILPPSPCKTWQSAPVLSNLSYPLLFPRPCGIKLISLLCNPFKVTRSLPAPLEAAVFPLFPFLSFETHSSMFQVSTVIHVPLFQPSPPIPSKLPHPLPPLLKLQYFLSCLTKLCSVIPYVLNLYFRACASFSAV